MTAEGFLKKWGWIPPLKWECGFYSVDAIYMTLHIEFIDYDDLDQLLSDTDILLIGYITLKKTINMKKHIILSGPPSSGKTKLSTAIALTHDLIYSMPMSDFLEQVSTPETICPPCDLIVVEECTKIDILSLNNYVSGFPVVPVVFETQEKIEQSEVHEIFNVIQLQEYSNRIQS